MGVMEEGQNRGEDLSAHEMSRQEPAGLIDLNLFLLSWLIDHELRSAERYRRFVALMMVTSPDRSPCLRNILMRTKRDSDKFFEFGNDCAILMSETDMMGALAAANRYKSICDGEFDLRFAIASFPFDGVNCMDLLGASYRRLNEAKSQTCGAVVSSG
jgi:hypothetical protein